jgi:hypothetical protein
MHGPRHRPDVQAARYRGRTRRRSQLLFGTQPLLKGRASPLPSMTIRTHRMQSNGWPLRMRVGPGQWRGLIAAGSVDIDSMAKSTRCSPAGSRSRPCGMCEGCHLSVRFEQGQRSPAACRVMMVRTLAFVIVRRVLGLVSGIPYAAGHQRPRLAGPCGEGPEERRVAHHASKPAHPRGPPLSRRAPRRNPVGAQPPSRRH